MGDPDPTTGTAGSGAGSVTVHFDGACQTVRGHRVAAYGWTADGPGVAHEECGLAVPPDHERATNNVAEYVGAIRALEWLAATAYRGSVQLVGDSELVVRQMTGEYEVRAPHLRSYHERLSQLAALFPVTRFRSVPREENQRADALSKQGIERAFRPVLRSSLARPAPDEPGPGG